MSTQFRSDPFSHHRWQTLRLGKSIERKSNWLNFRWESERERENDVLYIFVFCMLVSCIITRVDEIKYGVEDDLSEWIATNFSSFKMIYVRWWWKREIRRMLLSNGLHLVSDCGASSQILKHSHCQRHSERWTYIFNGVSLLITVSRVELALVHVRTPLWLNNKYTQKK